MIDKLVLLKIIENYKLCVMYAFLSKFDMSHLGVLGWGLGLGLGLGLEKDIQIPIR